MTEQSYHNYLINISNLQASLGALVADKVEKGSCNNCKSLKDLRISNMFLDILSCYQLEKEEYSEVYSYPACGIGHLYLTTLTGLPFPIVPGDSVSSIYLPEGTKVTDIVFNTSDNNTYIYIDHAFTFSSKVPFDVTFSRTNDVLNCLSIEQVQGMIDTLNKIYNVSYCMDLLLNEY